MKQFDAEILENRELAEDYFEMFFAWPEGIRVPFPGQVVSFNVDRAITPFLRRPFALASYQRDTRVASVIYHVRGPATHRMAEKRPGEVIDTLGPRGFYFQLGKEANALLVGGGIGTGPMVFAANWLAAKGFSPRLVLGYRHENLVPHLELSPLVRLSICTDDGSQGFHGTTVAFLDSLPAADLDDAFVWGCGPNPMLKALHFWAQPRGLPCKVSLEEVMACGVGACVGCTVETTDARQMVRVCTEGPVFASEVIRWT
jgi:dihydroorotate dehydrogenase electron transfer subunit